MHLHFKLAFIVFLNKTVFAFFLALLQCELVTHDESCESDFKSHTHGHMHAHTHVVHKTQAEEGGRVVKPALGGRLTKGPNLKELGPVNTDKKTLMNAMLSHFQSHDHSRLCVRVCVCMRTQYHVCFICICILKDSVGVSTTYDLGEEAGDVTNPGVTSPGVDMNWCLPVHILLKWIR